MPAGLARGPGRGPSGRCTRIMIKMNRKKNSSIDQHEVPETDVGEQHGTPRGGRCDRRSCEPEVVRAMLRQGLRGSSLECPTRGASGPRGVGRQAVEAPGGSLAAVGVDHRGQLGRAWRRGGSRRRRRGRTGGPPRPRTARPSRWPPGPATRRGCSVAMCSSWSTVASAVDGPRDGRHHRVGPEALQRGRVPPVGLDHEIAVALEVVGQPADRLAQPQVLVDVVARRWRSTTTPGPRPGSRPACSAARRTVSTQRIVVSSVKNVWRMTPSNTRPPNARELGPKAETMTGMSSSKLASRCRNGNVPAGPSWLKIISPCHSRRMIPTKSSIWALVIGGRP